MESTSLASHTSWDALWTHAKALGHWAWDQNRKYLPRDAWRTFRDKIPNAAIDPSVRVEVTRQAAGDTLWRNLWNGSARQRLLRKMFELASSPSMTQRDLLHLAFNAGQVEASDAVERLRQLAKDDPRAASLRNTADIYDALRMGELRTYVSAELAAKSSPMRLTDNDIREIMNAIDNKEYSKPTSPLEGKSLTAVIVATCLVILIVIAYYAGRLLAPKSKPLQVFLTTAAFLGAGALIAVTGKLLRDSI